MGAIVHTTVSSDEGKLRSQEFGAHHPINYKTTSIAEYVNAYTAGQGFDYVFDTVGGPNLEASFQAARLNGSIACIATGGTHDLSLMYSKGLSLHSVLMLIPLITGRNRHHYGKILFEIKKMVEAGQIKPLVHSEVFSWSQISKAHTLQESGHHQGKIAITID
jgi:NADPH2:quinone reductase